MQQDRHLLLAHNDSLLIDNEFAHLSHTFSLNAIKIGADQFFCDI